MIDKDHWTYRVAGIKEGELFPLHLVALARAEFGDRLVALHDGQNIHGFVRLERGDLRDGREFVVLLLDAAVGCLLDLCCDVSGEKRPLKRLAESSYSFFSGL